MKTPILILSLAAIVGLAACQRTEAPEPAGEETAGAMPETGSADVPADGSTAGQAQTTPPAPTPDAPPQGAEANAAR